MLAEIANALFVTYLATEYGTPSSQSSRTSRSTSKNPFFAPDETDPSGRKLQRIVIIGLLVLVINICDDIVGLGILYHSLANVFVILHIPKVVVFVPSAYLTALYYDCRASVARIRTKSKATNGSTASSGALSFREFFPRVARLFLRILPIYPIGAVLISFCFMFVIALFDLLHIPEGLLNWPIYYGTLYGPFSYIYYVTKRDVIRESLGTLPLSMASTA